MLAVTAAVDWAQIDNAIYVPPGNWLNANVRFCDFLTKS